jgi:hypothetical protein
MAYLINPFWFAQNTAASVAFWENTPTRQRLGYNNGGYSSLLLQKVTFSNAVPWNKAFMIAANQNANAATISLTMSLGLYTKNGTSLSLLNSASGAMTANTTGTWASWLSFATSAAVTYQPGEYYLGVVGSNAATTTGAILQVGGLVSFTSFSIHSLNGLSTASNASLPATVASSDINWQSNSAVRYIVLTA